MFENCCCSAAAAIFISLLSHLPKKQLYYIHTIHAFHALDIHLSLLSKFQFSESQTIEGGKAIKSGLLPSAKSSSFLQAYET